ncbi:hypothetical protein [Achromobacter denitrificans]|uniref:hypothetical protein n=1 Tax=Achromobacter denitrificans TaxID=32002 RepID=UPI003B974661
MGKRHAWIAYGRAKDKRACAVPLTSDGMAVLQRRQGPHPTLVFGRRPRPDREAAQISQIDSLILASACKQVWHNRVSLLRFSPYLGLVARTGGPS